MQLTKLYLQDFRAFTQQTWEFAPTVTVLVAANGVGKTTILEAIYLLSTGKSFRAEKTLEMVRFDQEIARVYGLIDDGTRLGITLTKGLVNGRKTQSKLFTLGEAKKRQRDFVGQLLAASFRPEDLRLIEGSPSRRRDYLDQPLSAVSEVYREALQHYQATLLRRNKLLAAIREGEATAASLPYWDENLLTFGEIINKQREKYIDFINEKVKFWLNFTLVYDHSQVTRVRLQKYQTAEMAVGHSLIGPHRDDFDILFDFGDGEPKSLLAYGSRGQQRMAVLWLKLAELQFLQEKTSQQPILLLDDILSELDEEMQTLVSELMTKQQTIVTTTDEKVLKKIPVKTVKIIKL